MGTDALPRSVPVSIQAQIINLLLDLQDELRLS
jgi:ABC-type oligopeptide transport system ATPase subunit